MFLFNKALIYGCNIIATTILTEFCIISSASAFSLDLGRADITWNANDLTNIYEFDPSYTAQYGDLYVKLTVSTDPTDDGGNPPDVYAIDTPQFGTTPGIYLGDQPSAGTGGFDQVVDELFVFTNRNLQTPETISLTIEFFEDDAGAIPTNVTDFNTTFTDLDAGRNGVRQETVTFTGADKDSNDIDPTFTVPTNSQVTIDNDLDIVTGYTSGITDDRGNVNVKFNGDVHKVTVDFTSPYSSSQNAKDRHMYMYDLGITPTDIAVTPVPFEFSPTIGIVMSLGLLGSNYLRKQYL